MTRAVLKRGGRGELFDPATGAQAVAFSALSASQGVWAWFAAAPRNELRVSTGLLIRTRSESRLASVRTMAMFRPAMEAAVKVWTDEELMALPKDGYKRELLEGEITMSPAGSEHGIIAVAVCAELRAHARRYKLGAVFDSSTGFRLSSDNLLSPDAAFVSQARLVSLRRVPRGFFPGAPDLVVEVLSPSDTHDYIHEKMARYFAGGSRLAWAINPAERNAIVYRTPEADRLLRVTDGLDGEDVLPGFRLPLAELFAELSFE